MNTRDHGRTTRGKTYNLVTKHTQPPKDQGGWMAVSMKFLKSEAFRSLSMNARKAWDRLLIEHIGHNRRHNGKLIITHEQFIAHGVTAEYVGDAIDELVFKGLVKAERGRAGNGTAHPTIFRLASDGDWEGAAATNEWSRITEDDVRRWSKTVREECRQKRARVGKKKSPLRVSEIRPLRVSEIRSPTDGRSTGNSAMNSDVQPISGIRSALDSLGDSPQAHSPALRPARAAGGEGRDGA